MSGDIPANYDVAAFEYGLTAKPVTVSDLGQYLKSVKGHLDKRFDAVDKRFDKLERRVDEGFKQINERVDGLEGRFDHLEGRFDRLESRLERAGVIPPED